MDKESLKKHLRKIGAGEYGELTYILRDKENIDSERHKEQTKGIHPQGCGSCVIIRKQTSESFMFYMIQPYPVEKNCHPVDCIDSQKCLVTNSCYPPPKQFSELNI